MLGRFNLLLNVGRQKAKKTQKRRINIAAFFLFAFPLAPALPQENVLLQTDQQNSLYVPSGNPQSYQEVKTLLANAAQAMRTKDYHGYFIYQAGNRLDSLEIAHIVRDGREYERVEHLNGPRRAFLHESGIQSGCRGASLFSGVALLPTSDGVQLAEHYQFYIRGGQRIAGRDSVVVQILPKDRLRYGLVLALDLESGLPLMSATTNINQKALERFQFVNLFVGQLPNTVVNPQHQFNRIVEGSCEARNDPSRWQVSWLPSGFKLLREFRLNNSEALHYSDGVSSFTVYVNSDDSKRFKPVSGSIYRGATLAMVSHLMDDQHGTRAFLVGELPHATARKIVSSLQFRP